ncbi:MAG TPA: ATP synthase F1 subunit epsilon [Gemmataceae bacterium]|nr:ATP synthase F1 subunit epsilon [Gemmataceae bacterium]
MDAPTLRTHQLQCVVVTPERALLDETVDFVALPMYDGELGVLPGRAPLIGRLGPGELRIRQHDRVRRYYIDGGFAQVRANVVTVLTPRALPAEAIDVQAAEQALEAATARPAPAEAPEARLRDQARARAQLRVAQRATGGQEGHG